MFITECECDNTDMERTPIEWWFVSGVCTHGAKERLHPVTKVNSNYEVVQSEFSSISRLSSKTHYETKSV